MNFKNIPAKYRSIPFWSWNDKLYTDETERQIGIMHEIGIGGFFMHARGGLQTEYMSDAWFENIETGIKTAEKYGMDAWAYDENGWPSGFGGGVVNKKGEKFQQKYLRFKKYDGTQSTNTIAIVNGIRFFYEVNPFYVDTLDGEVIADFINEIYDSYYKRFKDKLKGFFTDEPQISRNGIPWSFIIPNEYELEYGESIFPHLPELFYETADYKLTRIRFWKLITKLFSKNYMKQIYDWCTKRGLEFTGHFVCEETFESQLTANGAVMPHYEYFTIPGIDSLGRRIIRDLTAFQIGSAAAQLGKKQVLSESFALCGHNVSFNELKAIYQYQMVHGVNLLCQHLEGYSLRGMRKRDYPPAMYYQQPWWSEYNVFCDAMSRIGMILAEGKIECDTLLIHPQTSAWVMFNNNENHGLEEFYDDFKKTVNTLVKKHILFHLGDEILIERHGKVDRKKFIIGNMEYSTVVLPPTIMLFENTERLIQEFINNGGRVVKPDEICADSSVVDNPAILYTKRVNEGIDIYFFINDTDEIQKAKINIGSKIIDIKTGQQKEFYGIYTFDKYESVLVIDDGLKQTKYTEPSKNILNLSGMWDIEKTDLNILTLDYCDYYFDGELIEKNGYVLNIQNRACKLKCAVKIRQHYKFDIESKPTVLYLVCETPEMFEISVNGNRIESKCQTDWVFDKSFKKTDISKYIATGENIITFITEFKQSDKVYDSIEKSYIFESEKNKLTFDMEIEPCYLLGNFGVKMDGKIKELERNAFRFEGKFIITDAPQQVKSKEIEKQGFPFFAGCMVLKKEFELTDTNYEMNFDLSGFNSISVNVNESKVDTVLWRPYRVDISHFLKIGKNIIRLELKNNLRNMMGPHHLEEGECFLVAPRSFYKEKCVWLAEENKAWNENYCFVKNSF